MPYSYNDTAYSDATMVIHSIGMLYCIPMLVIAVLKRNVLCTQSMHIRTLSSQQLTLALDSAEESINMEKQKHIGQDEKQKEIKINKQFVQYSITSIILYTNCLFFSVISSLPLNPPMSEAAQNIFDVIAQQSWVFGQLFCYLIFTQKLKSVFENTEYEIPLKYYKYLYSSIILFAVGEIILSATILLQSANIITLDAFVIIAVIESVIKLIFSILLSVSMVYLFVHTLLQISIDSDYGNSSFDDSVSSNRDKYQQLLSDISIKLSVLSFWALLSTQVFVLMSAFVFILWASIGVDELGQMAAMLWFHNFFWVVSSTVNVTSLFLNLPSSSKRYIQCCNSCHKFGKGLGQKKVIELNSKVDTRYTIMKDNPDAKFSL